MGDVVAYLAGYGYLILRGLTEADADSIAKSIAQECSDAYRTLDTAVLTFACLGDAEMKRKTHILALHAADEETHGTYHDSRVAGLDRDDDIVEAFLLADAQKLHAALHDTLGCVTIAAHDAVREAAVVDSYAEGGMIGPANIDKGDKSVGDALHLGSILLVGIVDVAECACCVDVVAWIDADALYNCGCDISHSGIEMDVGDEGREVALLVDGLTYVPQTIGFAGSLRRKPDVVSTGADDGETLLYAAFDVGRGCRRHALKPDGIAAAKRGVAYMDDSSPSPMIIEVSVAFTPIVVHICIGDLDV